MGHYRKKAAVFEAVQFTRESVLTDSPKEKHLPPWVFEHFDLQVTDKIEKSEFLKLKGAEVGIYPGTWIIRDADGFIDSATDEQFKAAYESV